MRSGWEILGLISSSITITNKEGKRAEFTVETLEYQSRTGSNDV